MHGGMNKFIIDEQLMDGALLIASLIMDIGIQLTNTSNRLSIFV